MKGKKGKSEIMRLNKNTVACESIAGTRFHSNE
jgi:hypothetical protein